MDLVPPRKVFQQLPQTARERHEQGTYELPGFLHPTLTKDGEMATVFQGHPFPRKGFVYSEGVMAVAKAKRTTLALFQPFADMRKGIIGFLESYTSNWIRLVDSVFADCERIPYLKYQYYSNFSRAVRDFVFLLLRTLGLSFETSYRAGLVWGTMFEYDDAYKIRPLDVLSETTLEKLLKNPRKELLRLAVLISERDKTSTSGEKGAAGRIISAIKMLSYLLWFPPVKKAFRFALKNCDFSRFQYDEIENYWSLNRIDYDSRGRSFPDRRDEQIAIMVEYAKTQFPGKEIKTVYKDDGNVDIVAV